MILVCIFLTEAGEAIDRAECFLFDTLWIAVVYRSPAREHNIVLVLDGELVVF